MSFQPSSKVYFGTVPWNPSYRHVRKHPSRDAQFASIKAMCTSGTEDYTYQRMDNAGYRPYNAESLYGMNYCMFQNANYGSRWFYSFIPRIEYVSPNSTRLYLQTDIMQTWFPDCTVKSCMVEREHVMDDTIGAHIKDEGINPGERNAPTPPLTITTWIAIWLCPAPWSPSKTVLTSTTEATATWA